MLEAFAVVVVGALVFCFLSRAVGFVVLNTGWPAVGVLVVSLLAGLGALLLHRRAVARRERHRYDSFRAFQARQRAVLASLRDGEESYPVAWKISLQKETEDANNQL